MNEKKQFEFRYQGENFIDLNTLITSQFHFLAAVNELQKELYPDVDMKLRVGAFKEGSFIVDLLMETNWKDHLFNKDNAELIVAIVGGFASLVEVHKYLKGRKAEEIEEKGDSINIQVEGEKNSIVVDKRVFNIYKNNIVINKSIQQNFEMLEDDKEIEGVEISETTKKGKRKILEVERKEFEKLSHENPYLSRDTMDETHNNQVLFIKKANIMPEKNRVWKWEFLHKGRDITARITDWSFAERINAGERIGQGDRLVADLKIGYKFSEKFATFIENQKYEVIKVHKLIGREEQGKMF